MNTVKIWLAGFTFKGDLATKEVDAIETPKLWRISTADWSLAGYHTKLNRDLSTNNTYSPSPYGYGTTEAFALALLAERVGRLVQRAREEAEKQEARLALIRTRRDALQKGSH